MGAMPELKKESQGQKGFGVADLAARTIPGGEEAVKNLVNKTVDAYKNKGVESALGTAQLNAPQAIGAAIFDNAIPQHVRDGAVGVSKMIRGAFGAEENNGTGVTV